MYRFTTFAKFPLLENQKIDTKQNKDEESGEGGGGKKPFKIPAIITHPPNSYKTIEYKGYRFFLQKDFTKKRGKDSEFGNRNDKC